MAECDDPTIYNIEECCVAPIQNGPGDESPIGPPGPAGPPGPSKFPFIFVFGGGINSVVAGAKIAIPVPTNGSFVSWQIRVAADVTADAEFQLRYAATPTGALTGVGGTQPEIVGVKGDRQTTVDWGITSVVVGGVLECEYVSGDALGVTLMVEYAT